jgi:hypothetical protein
MMGKLEVALWNCNKSTFKYGAISLRNRCFFLYTKQSLSRGESGVNADLSELVDFEIQASREPQPYHILILQMTKGKTNGIATLFGRVMRAMHTEWVTSVHHFQIGRQSTRKHWSDSEKKRYSRIKKVIDIVSGLEAQHNSILLATILSHVDDIFKTRCNGAISTFISWSSNNAIQIAPPHTTCPATVTPQTAEV